jgi:hypothetical protein
MFPSDNHWLKTKTKSWVVREVVVVVRGEEVMVVAVVVVEGGVVADSCN